MQVATDITPDMNVVALWVDGLKVRVFDSLWDAGKVRTQVNDHHREWARDALGLLAATLAKTPQKEA